MTNLLKETIQKLNENNKTENDILWVGSENYKTTWEHFKTISDIEYDSGYGGNEISMDLLIVGKDFWLERHEYDGSEWWEYKQMPKEPINTFDFKTVIITGWNSLEEENEINNLKGDE